MRMYFCGVVGRSSHSSHSSRRRFTDSSVWVTDGWSEPKEVGYYIPPITEATDVRCVQNDGVEECKTAIQTNNLEVDNRGYVYAVDRANTGMHIVELTGAARDIANFE